jgi:hypothetical protein
VADRVSVAIIPINGDTVPSCFDYCTKISCRGSPANAVTYFEDSGLVAGHCFPRLIFNFTPTNLPSLSKITPASSTTRRIAVVRFAFMNFEVSAVGKQLSIDIFDEVIAGQRLVVIE